MPVYKICTVCKKEFAVTPSLAEKREFCSLACRGASQQTLVEKECSVCGKSFKIKAYRKSTATCSKECGYVAKKIKKICVTCGIEFLVPKSRENAKACSNACARDVRGNSIKRQVALVCEHCGKAFEEAQSHAGRRRFCSIDCRDASPVMKSEMSQRVAGDLNPMWAGGIAKQSEGYVYKHTENHPFSEKRSNYVLEHRLVMEEWLRREEPDHDFMITIYDKAYLRPEIQVHHIDLNKANNSITNLIAVTLSAHRAIHNGNKPKAGSYWPETIEVFINN